MKLCKALCPPC